MTDRDARSLVAEAPFGDDALGDLARAYLGALLSGDRHRASDIVLAAVEAGTSVRDVYLRVFQPVQHEVGRLWQTNQVSVAQEHFITAATQMVMSQLYPRIFRSTKIGRRLVATCVGGELHEIGVRMVADFFEMEGWDTYYLGASTPAASILDTIAAREADVLAVSTTITYNVGELRDLVAEVRASHVAADLRILVGGRPFNLDPELWRRVEADGYAPDALGAIRTAESLLDPSTARGESA